MPRFLCFADLLASSEGTGSDDDDPLPVVPFAHEENKKSSFILQRPLTLVSETHSTPQDDRSKDVTLRARACISCCISEDVTPQSFAPHSREAFLFGGFELIANVKSVEVYRDAPEGEESYLTTCKGIPMRDIQPLPAIPAYITDGESEGGGRSGIAKTEDIMEGPLDDGSDGKIHMDCFYKFIFVAPGGPRPLERVTLNFLKGITRDDPIKLVIIRVLKMKGRLDISQLRTPQSALPFGTGASNKGVPDNNMPNLATVMSVMGGKMPSAMQMAQQQQQLSQSQMQSPCGQYAHAQHQQQQQTEHQLEKNQAEIIAAIAGLGIFVKASEERTMKKIEMMEERIMARLDNITERLSAIDRSSIDPHEDSSEKT